MGGPLDPLAGMEGPPDPLAVMGLLQEDPPPLKVAPARGSGGKQEDPSALTVTPARGLGGKQERTPLLLQLHPHAV